MALGTAGSIQEGKNPGIREGKEMVRGICDRGDGCVWGGVEGQDA